MSATELWALVKERYDDQTLISLTNVRDRSALGEADAVGIRASQDIIDLFPLYAQAEYDKENPSHRQVGISGVVAILWARGGTVARAQAMKWEEWEALVERLKLTGARGHGRPRLGSSSLSALGPYGRACSWSNPLQLRGLLPRRCSEAYGVMGGPTEWD